MNWLAILIATVAGFAFGAAYYMSLSRPWLAAIAAWLDECVARREPGIVSCSALKRKYRRILLEGRPEVRLVYLQGEMPLIGRRMARRRNHFMPTSLLESQFAALEEPVAEEWPIVVPIDTIDAMQAAAEKLAATEARIIAAAKSGGGVEAIKTALRG